MTEFRGHKTGFKPGGSNDCCPNPMGPPDTKFMGRGGLPEGQLKHYPGAVADISNGNRRLSKSGHGDGGGSSTVHRSNNAFGKTMGKGQSSGGSPAGDGKGRGAMKANKK
jgi:hypothetical protein